MHPLRRTRALVLAASTLAGVASLAAAGGPALAAGPVTLGPTRAVPLVLGGLSRARYLGAVAPGTTRSIGVFLNRPDPAGEQQLYAALYDPSSPSYHRFLTPAQFDARYGVPASETRSTESWLRAGGLTIDSADGAGDYLTAHGTVARLDSRFGVRIGRYRLAGTTFVANNRAPQVPSALPVEAVVGLDTLHRFSIPAGLQRSVAHPGRAPVGNANKPAAGSAVKRAATPAASFSGILKPSDLWGVYDQPAGDMGQGQVAGLFGEGDPTPVITNLRLFEQHYSFPKVPVRTVLAEGGKVSDYSDNSGNIEWYLDSQAITGMAPDLSRLDLYFAKSLFDTDVYAEFANWVNDRSGPPQMNASFGECEADPLNPITGPLAQQPYGTELGNQLEVQLGGEQILRQATVEGRTLFAAAGDTGSGCPEVVVPVAGAGNGLAIQPVPDVGYPAASQYAVAVGGTVVTTGDPQRGQRQSEVSWTFTGGGSSHYISAPSFQRSQKAVDQNCWSEPDGSSFKGTQPCRGVPDIAAMSGNVLGNGYSIYIDGNLSSEGGTSLSSPLSVGMWVRIQAAAAALHKRNLGFADPALYRAAGKRGTFYDVTQAETPAGNGAYQPAPGWDYTSGLGTPDVTNLIKAIVGSVPRLSGSVRLPPPAVSCTAGQTSPSGNATDPVDVQLGTDPGLDITAASLHATRSTVVATFTGPAVTAANPPTATAGRDLYLLWSWAKAGQTPVEYFLDAHIDSAGLVTVTSGQSSGQPDSDYSYTPSPTTAATGTVAGSTLTVKAPLSEVGAPPAGALLSYPFTVVQEDVGNPNVAGSGWAGLALTADTAARPVGVDPAIGQAVKVGC